jgi:hypothetical protein
MTSPHDWHTCLICIGILSVQAIIPAPSPVEFGCRDRFRDPSSAETASMPSGFDGGLAEGTGAPSNPYPYRLVLGLLRLNHFECDFFLLFSLDRVAERVNIVGINSCLPPCTGDRHVERPLVD